MINNLFHSENSALNLEDIKNNIIHSNLDYIKKIIFDEFNIHYMDDYLLTFAVSMNKTEITKYLVDCGADIHVNDDIALNIAIKNENIELMLFFISKGADINNIRSYNKCFYIQYSRNAKLKKIYE